MRVQVKECAVSYSNNMGLSTLLGAPLLALALALLVPQWIDHVWAPVVWGAGLAVVGALLTLGLVTLLPAHTAKGSNLTFRRWTAAALFLSFLAAQFSLFRQLTGGEGYQQAEWIVLILLGGLTFALIRHALARQHQPLVRRLTLASTLLYLFYAALAFAPLWAAHGAPSSVVALLVAATALWASLVAQLIASAWLPNKAPHGRATAKGKAEAPAWRIVLNDYLTLMKYRVASLLLATTLGAMVIAAQGWPGWALVGWVMLGGVLSVGGAGALNHYLDRDVDKLMGRTSLRPLPSGRIAPWKALTFGLLLSLLQFLLFWFKVNPFSAWLSTAGLLYYVILYTIILKRHSSQNIVIGGAAGAFPPLVGWAAVTGELSWVAGALFAIVFLWTPPHFWALALMRKEDYARAKIPMLPVVAGEENTRLQIVLYTGVMLVATLVLVPLRMMGWLYLVAAILLNVKFLWDALKLYRQPSNKVALSLYKYSLLYLFLLFAAMAVDRALV